MVSGGFGLVTLRGEGAPIHPDDFSNEDEISDVQYLRQLQAYKDHYKLGISDFESIVRQRLIPELK